MTRILSLIVLLVLGFAFTVSAQERVTITPVLEFGNYSHSVDTSEGASGYASTVSKHSTVQKGFEVRMIGNARWSTKLRFTTGGIDTPKYRLQYNDGRVDSSGYFENTTNALFEFNGSSRVLEAMGEYSRGPLTYRFGVGYRLLETEDAGTIYEFSGFSGFSRDVRSTISESFFAPKVGITAKHRFNKLTPHATVDLAPMIRHAGHYTYRSEGYPDYEKTGSTWSSRGLDVDLGASYSVHKYVAVGAGWRYSRIYTERTDYLFTNPYGPSFPNNDTWGGPYFSVRLQK
ncbi:MAG: hypothetical protein A3C49_03240 [Candidatus Doudnabacteria bacterium RIFCSPHIGHO2_02_FULL_42_25]|uniref:Outer membrane protein beta-barrel domain-containing protein n=1 Tax=Candidatus Doudnabacteria bacterium RIFCSPHIGHO2_01_FULL_41_86 TaxID=1817821 RepID=A0A1F5N9Y5_9BACT|nr:MAG: hypothetical protein A2717_02835 [Candidatus Doudnabacteria bacterium RIFCSPHIGHO2_01_FULL_41_86]OGE85484.1 MAG: hypothetical protein A3E28_02405 [Candidatus Doudnabacteria bacterium RIFCSPHIGHO2_12_FULL_42_22]OGE87022.1 MAG: hypothetical protein A3C49_03240 [Candidatus Doudnabacteria bacterium RIFCSPHIGHO2_02_FULL_42_25]OGE92621.1 MAG: hypothetical protein A2895_03395 [Candidatus Doudnabacteria bacterium RIFCSPLOWO2_01_FULL_42_60]OGE98782.1 MAG: hypothetical protein A3G89_04620 [Candid